MSLIARYAALAFSTAIGAWVIAMIVSLALGTTQFGWTTPMRTRVQVGAEMLMWFGVAASVAHTALDILLGLAGKLGLKPGTSQ